MPSSAGLGQYDIVAFVTIVDVERAKRFYRDTLGLRFLGDELPFAIVFEANGIMLRLVVGKERPPVPGTVLGWRVPDAVAAVKQLMSAGVQFERYEFMSRMSWVSGLRLPGRRSPGLRIRTEIF